MKSCAWLMWFGLWSAASAVAGMKPVVYRLASLPASVEPGQKLVLCAANIGTGELDVSLEFINVRTGGVAAGQTVKLAPLGAGAPASPCVTATAETIAGSAGSGGAGVGASGALENSFAAGTGSTGPADGQALVVGVAMVRKALLSFREAQVTASIQVLGPDGNGGMRTVQTIPLSRTTHPSDGAPVYAPPADGGHHK